MDTIRAREYMKAANEYLNQVRGNPSPLLVAVENIFGVLDCLIAELEAQDIYKAEQRDLRGGGGE